LAQVNVISVLTLNRNLFESKLWKTLWRHLANENSHNEFLMTTISIGEISKDDRALIKI